MARVLKIKDFALLDKYVFTPQNNMHVWMEIREGYYEAGQTYNSHALERTYGGKPYPALVCSFRNSRCVNKLGNVACQVEVCGGYEAWFNVFNDYGTGYNVKWRLWSKKPTEVERQNAAWDTDTIR